MDSLRMRNRYAELPFERLMRYAMGQVELYTILKIGRVSFQTDSGGVPCL